MTRRYPFREFLHQNVGGALLLSLDCSALPLIRILLCWVLGKEASSTIFASLVWLDLGLNIGLLDHGEHSNHHANVRQNNISKINYFLFFCSGFFVLFCFFFLFLWISTFVGYLMPNPFLYNKTALFQTIQFSKSTQFNYQKHFHFKLSSLVEQF